MGDRFRRPLGAAAALVCASLLAAGCGTRLPDEAFGEGQLVRASDDQLAAGDGTTDVTVPGDATAAGTDAATPSGSATATPGRTSTGAGGASVAGPAAGAKKANYASDVGVTATSIKIGNITTISGPMPGQFEPWLLGLRTWVNDTNQAGGLNGRKIELITCDDQMDSEKNKACARDLIEKQKVFAIVGTDTPAMPSAKYVNDQKVPAVGVAPIGNYGSIYPYWFGAYGNSADCPRNGVDDPGAPGYCIEPEKNQNATYKYFRDVVGVRKAAVFWHNIDISKQAGLAIKASLEQSGIQVAYTAETQVAEPDYTGHVLQMKDRGVEGVWDAMEINNNIRLMQAMDRQNWKPKAKVSTIAVWGQEVRDQVTGPSRETLYITGITKAYTDDDPAIVRFNQSFKRYFPNKKRHQWNVDGYAGALMFADAAKALGADLTREGLVAHLSKLVDYNPLGLYAQGLRFPQRPRSYYQQPAPPPGCFAVVKFKNDDFYAVSGGKSVTCVQGDWIEGFI